MTFGKVLSPQFFIWLLPVAALVLLDDVLVGSLALAAVVLTQVEFPGLYWSLVYLERPVIGLVYLEHPVMLVLVVRNALLLATFVAALVRLWRLAPVPPGERRGHAPSESSAGRGAYGAG